MKSSRSTTQALSSPATRPTFPIRTAPPRKPVYVPEPALPGPDSRRCIGRFTRSRATPGSARTATVVRAALPQPHSRRPEPQGHGAYLPLLAASPRLRTARRPAPGATATPVDTVTTKTRPCDRSQGSRVEQGIRYRRCRRHRDGRMRSQSDSTGAGPGQAQALPREGYGYRRLSTRARHRPAASGRRQRPAARRGSNPWPVGSGSGS